MLAEALWKQGIDIYSDLDNRLLAAGEYFARVNDLVPTPFLPFGTTDAYSAGTSDNSPEDSATPSLPLLNVASGGVANDSANNATNAGNAFDRNPATQWFTSGASGWLQYDLGPGHAQIVTRYTVTSSNDKVPRDPKDWQFQGSNDGSTWTILDSQNDQPFTDRYRLKTYSIVSPASYRFYRLNISANNGDLVLNGNGVNGCRGPAAAD